MNKLTTIGVIGLGLIGASILKDLQKHNPDVKRYGFSKGTENLSAVKDGLIVSCDNLQTMVNACDLIIIATPVHTVPEIAKKIAELKNSAKPLIVIDVASVKAEIAPIFKKLSTKNIHYIPTHSMGGSEKSGYGASRGGLFRQKPWIICLSGQDTDSFEILAQMLKVTHGANVLFLPVDIHDKYVALASHIVLSLSHLLFDFVNQKHPEVLKIAGESFITTTRLASDNPNMLSDIHESNAENIHSAYIEFLAFIEDKISRMDDLNVDYFSANKQARDNWLHHRNKL